MHLSKDKNKLSVFNFTSFRSFLRAYAEEQRLQRSHWSYARWAKDLGLQGTASLTMILNGQRNPGAQIIKALVTYFKFSEKEKAYFENLVNLEKVNSDTSLKYLVMQELKRLSPLKNFQLFDEEKFELISHWYHLALR